MLSQLGLDIGLGLGLGLELALDIGLGLGLALALDMGSDHTSASQLRRGVTPMWETRPVWDMVAT